MKHVTYLLLLVHATPYIEGPPVQDGRNGTDLIMMMNKPVGQNESARSLQIGLQQHDFNSSGLDHLANFHDFSAWNKEDIHEFSLSYGNDISGDEFDLLDQLGVESEQNVATAVTNKSQISAAIMAHNSTNASSLSNPGSAQVKLINTKEFARTVKTENKDPEVEDDTIRSLSSNMDMTEGIFSDNLQIDVKDNNFQKNDEESRSSILANENRQNEILLKKIQEQYERDQSSLSTYFEVPSKDIELPLITVSKIDPFSITVLVKPKTFGIYTMVRLMYERVPVSKPALLQNLDDPVIDYVPMYRGEQEHRLYNLPVGKYIICGEAFAKGTVFQANCVEARVQKHSTKQLQGGVLCVVAIALLVVFVVIVYAIYHRVVIYKLEKKN
eukprot:TRINITY_DN68468_c0_g1_i1.p1 TRINITY_DN68468_c0_g1~~TRINITY_DN68468_c0_g1_i1.p1  ORF type:complete len:385 (-),score=80.79 TRINITY_DN68468_c0_g1_i1:51-1205(-)